MGLTPDVIETSNLSKDEKNELKEIFEARKSQKRFIKFIEKHSKGFFKGGNYKLKHFRIKKSDLPSILKTIYKARSDYLHKGENMFLSHPWIGDNKGDIDSSLGMFIDNREWSESQKLPYTYFFEGIVRHGLLNFLKSNQKL